MPSANSNVSLYRTHAVQSRTGQSRPVLFLRKTDKKKEQLTEGQDKNMGKKGRKLKLTSDKKAYYNYFRTKLVTTV